MTTPSETALSAEDEAVARLRSLIENVVTTDEYRASYRDALATLDAARSQPATEGLDVDLLAQAIEMIGTRVVSDSEAGWRLYAEDVAHEYARLAATEPAGDERT